MNPVQLNNEQAANVEILIPMIEDIEAHIAKEIKDTSLPLLNDHLLESQTMLATRGKIMELATNIHHYALGVASEEAVLNEAVYNAKQEIQKRWFAGKLHDVEALYTRAEKVCSSLVHYIDSMRTIISSEKQLAYTEFNSNGRP